LLRACGLDCGEVFFTSVIVLFLRAAPNKGMRFLCNLLPLEHGAKTLRFYLW
jgi:hypothetical protein